MSAVRYKDTHVHQQQRSMALEPWKDSKYANKSMQISEIYSFAFDDSPSSSIGILRSRYVHLPNKHHASHHHGHSNDR